MRRARVVFTTCAGAGAGALQGCKFPVVIIDEGAQVLPACTASSTSTNCVVIELCDKGVTCTLSELYDAHQPVSFLYLCFR